MARRTRTNDWGFPRWRDYESERAATTVRRCDRDGCDRPGDRPAPKAPNRPERWWFCEQHAAEYNSRWDYFEGLSPEEAAARAEAARPEETFARAGHWAWGDAEGQRPRAERDALRALDLPDDADEDAVKTAHRRLAMAHHPDRNPGDAASADRFHAVQAAFEVLARAAERAGAAR